MARPDGELETYLTVVLGDQNPSPAAAHDDVYPERVAERIPAALIEETEPDRWRLRETFRLGA